MKIKDLPNEERPREKAITYGIDSLNNRELLAILLRTGYQGMSALDIADNLLKEFSSISAIIRASPQELSNTKGISKSKSLEILAIGALAKRDHLRTYKKFSNASEIYQFYRKRWELIPQEEIYLLSFNRHKSLISEHRLSLGNEFSSSISIGQTLSHALKDQAYGIVLLHNHPSNLVLPSKEDLSFTLELKENAYKLGIKLLDHIIIGLDSYFSFTEQNLLSD